MPLQLSFLVNERVLSQTKRVNRGQCFQSVLAQLAEYWGDKC